MEKTTLLLAAIVAAAISGAYAGETVVLLESEEGDYIGQGKTRTLSSNDYAVTVSRNFDNGVRIYLNNFSTPSPQEYSWWTVEFAAPYAQDLVVGSYENATRFPVQAEHEPGLSVSGDGRGCNSLTGRFDVLDVVYEAGSGEVLSFAADFEQHCEGMNPALKGSVRFASDYPLPVDVGAEVEGLQVTNYMCINKTTGKRVKVYPENAGQPIDCAQAGLKMNLGDLIRIRIDGYRQ